MRCCLLSPPQCLELYESLGTGATLRNVLLFVAKMRGTYIKANVALYQRRSLLGTVASKIERRNATDLWRGHCYAPIGHAAAALSRHVLMPAAACVAPAAQLLNRSEYISRGTKR